jgi:antitoxin MazE
MKTTLIPIGNSRGVRIPKPFIEQCGLAEQVEMDVRDCMILIRAPRQPRAGWADAFEQMAREQDDKLLDGQSSPSTRWDEKEWQWK